VIGLRVRGMLATEVLSDEGITVSRDEREEIDRQLEQGMSSNNGDIESLPQRYRDDFVEGIAAYARLVNEVGGDPDQATQVLFAAQSDADIRISPEFGTWNEDQFAVVPPPGASSGGSGGSGSGSSSG
jgi:hypothetical protein